MSCLIDALPNELLEDIFSWLGTDLPTKLRVLGVCRRWRGVGAVRVLWRSGDLHAPLWLPVPLARLLVAIMPSGLSLSVSVRTRSLTLEQRENINDYIGILMPSCESLRFTLPGMDLNASEEATFVTVPLLRRATPQLRHLSLNAATARAVLNTLRDAFANIEYYSLDEWVEHQDEPVHRGGLLEQVVEVVCGMPKLKVLAVAQEDTGLFESRTEGWAPLADLPIIEMTNLKLVLPAPAAALAKWQDFIRHCPRLESVYLGGLSPRETWPDDARVPPLRQLTLSHTYSEIGAGVEEARRRSCATLFVDRPLPLLEYLTVHGWQAAAAEGVKLADRLATVPRVRELNLHRDHFTVETLTPTLAEFHTLVGDDSLLDACPELAYVSLEIVGHWPVGLPQMAERLDALAVDFPFPFPPLTPLDLADDEDVALSRRRVTPPRTAHPDGRGAAGRWLTRVSVLLVNQSVDLPEEEDDGDVPPQPHVLTEVRLLVVRTRDE